MRGPFASQLVLMRQSAQMHISATVVSVGVALVVGIFVLMAVTFTAIALFFYLDQFISETGAALWVAVALLVAALVIWLIGFIVVRWQRRRARYAMAASLSPLAAAAGSFAAGSRTGEPPPAGTVPPPPAASGTATGASHAALLDQGFAVGAHLHEMVARRPGTLVAVGLGAGLALGLSPALRRGVRRLIPGL